MSKNQKELSTRVEDLDFLESFLKVMERAADQQIYPCDPIGRDAFEMVQKYAPVVAGKIQYRHNVETGTWQILHLEDWEDGVRIVRSKHCYSRLDRKHVPSLVWKKVEMAKILASPKNWEQVAGVPLEELVPLNSDEAGVIVGCVTVSENLYALENFPNLWK